MAKQRSENFRDWDIDVETGYSGYDQSRFPYYVWRETVDNRLMLGRPRYCCVTERNGELCFTFFDPSQNIRSTGALKVFGIVAAVVTAFLYVLSNIESQRVGGPNDVRTPPGLFVIAAFFYSLFFGGLISGIWYASKTVYRWSNGRFEGEGRITSVPLASLTGFQVLSAGEAGATVNGKPATVGHSLSAVFADGSQMILTQTAWDYPSIAERHRIMTRDFCSQRDNYLKPWLEGQKKAKPRPPPTSGGDGSGGGGIPGKL